MGSEELAFIAFTRTAAVFVMPGGHKSFFDGSIDEAGMKWRAEEDVWTLKGILPGADIGSNRRTRLALGGLTTQAAVGDKVVVSAPISTAGTSILQTMHRDRVARMLREVEPRLDREPVSVIGTENLLLLRGAPSWRWAFNCSDLVLVDDTSKIGFMVLPGPT